MRASRALLAAAGIASALAAPTSNSSSNGKEIMQHRLAYAGPTGMRIGWNTRSKVAHPLVLYGTDPSKLNSHSTPGTSNTYPTSTTYNNFVTIEALKPNTKYYYRVVGSPANETYSFTTSRPAGDSTPFNVAVAVDMGVMGKDGLSTSVGKGAANPLQPGDLNSMQSLVGHKDQFDFLLHPGDIAYADYWLKEQIQGYLPGYNPKNISDGVALYEMLEEEYFNELQPLTAVKPYMVGPGNHESNCDNGGTTDKTNNITYTDKICPPGQANFTGFINRFRMPSAESGGLGNFWWSMDYGMVHFVMVDTETDLGVGYVGPDETGGEEGMDGHPFGTYKNQQHDWLVKDLAAVDRSKTPWIVVGAHRPLYSSSDSTCFECRDAFAPIFEQYGVDLVMTGHAHLYERMVPVGKNGTLLQTLDNPTMPWYILNGAAGHYDGLDPLVYPLQNYSAKASDNTYGWTLLHFHNSTHLTADFIASRNGSVVDSATLYKARSTNATVSA